MEMTSKERLTSILEGRTPDRVASSLLINPYYTNSLPGKPDPIEFLKELGADIIDRDGPLPYDKVFTGGVEYSDVFKNGETIRTCTTPVGTVQETFAGPMAWGDISHRTSGFVKTLEDYKILQYVFENMQFTPNYDWYEERLALIGDYGILAPQATEFRSSLEYLLETDLERTIFDLSDHPEIVEEFLDALKEANYRACKVAAGCPATYYNVWEDSSTTLLSPTWFEEYVLPEFNGFTEILQQNGKKLIHHACGKIKNLLPLMKQESVVAFESVTPNPVGDVRIRDCFDAWDDKFTVIGGLDPTFLIRCSMEQLEERVVEIIESLGEYKKHFILANGDSLPPRVDREKLVKMIEIVKRYRFG
ncbi:MAG: uroporphyrinogen decarboxylase family protein [Lachnospiraceae bacterium]